MAKHMWTERLTGLDSRRPSGKLSFCVAVSEFTSCDGRGQSMRGDKRDASSTGELRSKIQAKT